MAARTTNKFKQKPALHFGDLMLPILGVVALAILIIGVKLLFFPSSTARKPIVVNQPQDVVAQQSSMSVATPVQPEQNQQAVNNQATTVTATVVEPQPVGSTVKPVQTKPVEAVTVSSKPQSSAATVKPAPVPSPTPAPTMAKSAFWVQCGSFTDDKAANSVVTNLKSKGFDASVQRAEVKGRTYFRVNVAGGATREQATSVESRVKALGYPTLVLHR